ncbi:hypothetical protein [Leptospira alstonii]|uniref:Uncharacterized protein n=1 Tax=Leptospira alstonii serovar Sichuan str. 79601 TaxID=1218565 RepID=M6D2L5_9LEPT|nr:hypothetical protein [Leptospira alstonii]AGS80460.1 hypothetical protein LEP1GSC193_0753 [Leptospira phage vB_LalZ_80412-LE1]EMJ95423.1 hypothetical protein LEP1GSC194_3553 [Leptospira alstonii serovar Sichuan str. 79601]
MKSFKNDFLKDNQIREYVDSKILNEIVARNTALSLLQTQILTKINFTEKGVPLGVATLGSDGFLLSNQRPPVPLSTNVFVFRPGEVSPNENVYSTWVTFRSAFVSKKGLKFLQFDDSLQGISIPPENIDFSECILLSRYKKQIPTAINFASGFLVSAWPIDVQGLKLNFSSHFFDNGGSTSLSLSDSVLEYTGTETGMDFFSGSLSVFLKNSKIVGNGRTVFSLGNRSIQIFGISGSCNVEAGCIQGGDSSTMTITNLGSVLTSGNSFVGIQGSFLGTKSESDLSHVFEKTLISKGQLVTRDSSGNFISVSPGLNNEILIFDSNSQGGFKPASIGSLFSLPGMKTLSDFVRQSSPLTSLLSAGSKTLDCSASNLFRITGGNATITFSNMTENEVVNVVLESTGSSYTITWSGGTFLWAGASIPTPTLASGRKDFYSFIKVGGSIYSSCILNMG